MLDIFIGIIYVVLLIPGSDDSSNQTKQPANIIHSNLLPKKGVLLWSEEFEYNGQPSLNDWDFEVGSREKEAQYYTPNLNAQVKNGNLIIEARKEFKDGFNYTSARLQSKKAFKYGVFEARVKIPSGRGTWPAVWLRAAKRPYKWPDLGEMDIMEHVGKQPGYVHASIHCAKHNHKKTHEHHKTAQTFVKNIFDDYHIYAIDWNKDRLKFYVDGRKYFEYSKYEESNESWPFNSEFNVVLNMAIGGKWAGAKGIDDSIFPSRYYVDYVRQYESVEK